MRTYLDCYPCFLKQALNAARRGNATSQQQFSVMKKVLSLLGEVPENKTPPEIGYRVHAIVRDEIGVSDPYEETKKSSTRQALALYPKLKSLVMESENKLETAIRLSIAGNILDFGVSDRPADLRQTIEHALRAPLTINDLEILRSKIDEVDWLLFLADNAGETVFDRVLIEALALPVIYGVKGGPILNDATLEDAIMAGLDKCAQLISNGSNALGTILDLCSDEFRRVYLDAPLIIAKGQANYETLSEAGEQVFCLLQVKCAVIGCDLDVPLGSLIVRRSG